MSEELAGFEPVGETQEFENGFLYRFTRPILRPLAVLIVDRAIYFGKFRRFLQSLWRSVRVFFIRAKVHYFVQVTEDAKCPACGIRKKHSVEWSEDYEKIMHTCARCKARWAESPVAAIDLWRVKTVIEPKQETIGKK